MKRLNKKAFTLIELIVVMAIIGILVLLAMPKFIGYTQKARLANIQHDTKVAEDKVAEYLIKYNKLSDDWTNATKEQLEALKSENKLYETSGLAKTIEDGEYKIIPDTFKAKDINSKLKGTFYANSEGKVYYEDTKPDKPDTEPEKPNKPENPEDLVDATCQLATDKDFKKVTDMMKGITYFRYIGTAECVVIPHIIHGESVTSYYRMFEGTEVKEVRSDNKNVTDMSWMFNGSQAKTLNLSSFDTSNVTDMSFMFGSSQATTLDLSSFDTSNVTNMSYMFYRSQASTLDLSSFDTSNVIYMNHMFHSSQATEIIGLNEFNTSNVTDMSSMFCGSQATILDLSSFDISNVTDMSWMFFSSKATIGYAKDQTDADRFNASTGSEFSLFVVKNQ